MAHRHSTPPPGVRRGTRAGYTSRPTPRGGIQKHSASQRRIDKDGDLEMDNAGGSGSSRGRGRGRGNDRRGRGTGSWPNRNGFNPELIQKAIFRANGSGEVNVRQASRGTEGLSQIAVRGWNESKAASNPDGGIKDLISFLERKASLRIKKSHVEGDALVIFVRPEDTTKVTRLDTYTFAGAPLSIGLWNRSEPISQDGAQLVDKITTMLKRRYHPELKLLDLSGLGTDPEFANSGMFDTSVRQTKFFLALMKVCDTVAKDPEQKREAVVSVSLANNALSNMYPVTTLAQTFPDIRNLDLSNNNVNDLSAMEAWRWKFRSLDHLILAGNPIESQDPTYQVEILKWYPKLRTLNNIQVRTDDQIATTSRSLLPIPTLPPSFRDEAEIGGNFVKQFFPFYDTDRSALISGYYDSQSSFSLSVNVSAPRSADLSQAKINWDQYIRKSRNLTKITTLPARMARLFKGTEKIRNAWLTLPSTKHPDLVAGQQKWCIECHSMPGLPDPSGQSSSGVGGLVVTVHGEFEEVDVSTGNTCNPRSFDRTFMLGPGGGPAGVRVLNDVLVLRAYGGSEAWVGNDVGSINEILPNLDQPLQIQIPDGFGSAGPGKSHDQIVKECKALELSKVTKMTLEYSAICLEQSGWSLDAAMNAFENAKANLPAEAFYPS